MSSIRSLPKLAAMFLTEGHRIPAELLASPASEPTTEPESPDPLGQWECRLDGTRQYGQSPAAGNLPMRPPEY